MRPSINYDHLTHGDHIHWCNIEALGVTRCEAQALQEHSAAANADPIAEVSVSMLIAMSITMVAGLIWGVTIRAGRSDRWSAGAEVMSKAAKQISSEMR